MTKRTENLITIAKALNALGSDYHYMVIDVSHHGNCHLVAIDDLHRAYIIPEQMIAKDVDQNMYQEIYAYVKETQHQEVRDIWWYVGGILAQEGLKVSIETPDYMIED